DRQDICDLIRSLKNRAEVLDVVRGAHAMPGLQDLRDFLSHRRNIRGISHLDIDRLNPFVLDEIIYNRDRNQNRLVVDFVLAEGARLLTERPDYAEIQLMNLNRLPDGGRKAAEHADGELLREHGHVFAQAHIALVEAAAAEDYQISDLGVVLIHAI